MLGDLELGPSVIWVTVLWGRAMYWEVTTTELPLTDLIHEGNELYCWDAFGEGKRLNMVMFWKDSVGFSIVNWIHLSNSQDLIIHWHMRPISPQPPPTPTPIPATGLRKCPLKMELCEIPMLVKLFRKWGRKVAGKGRKGFPSGIWRRNLGAGRSLSGADQQRLNAGAAVNWLTAW